MTSRLQVEEAQESVRKRQKLLRQIGRKLGVTPVSFFTSFAYPVMIQDNDADMIEDVLQHTDLSEGLCLIVNSPGGLALAAERVVRVCRVFSEDNFLVLIPRRAKSAATMIALGADKIYMGETSELGPIGTQIMRFAENAPLGQYSVQSMIKSYDELMRKADKTKGRVEPYLLQLEKLSCDAATIEELRMSEKLARDIAIRWLSQGMMRGQDEKTIAARIRVFLDPGRTKAHGRGIFQQEATNAGLKVELLPGTGQLWGLVSELYERTNLFVSSEASKVVESANYSFSIPPPPSALGGEEAFGDAKPLPDAT